MNDLQEIAHSLINIYIPNEIVELINQYIRKSKYVKQLNITKQLYVLYNELLHAGYDDNETELIHEKLKFDIIPDIYVPIDYINSDNDWMDSLCIINPYDGKCLCKGERYLIFCYMMHKMDINNTHIDFCSMDIYFTCDECDCYALIKFKLEKIIFGDYDDFITIHITDLIHKNISLILTVA